MERISTLTLLVSYAGCIFIPQCLACCADPINVSQPMSPSLYSYELGFGFETNWFKTDPSLVNYNAQSVQDVYSAGFRNLRLRCSADLYNYPYNNTKFATFLDNLETVVDKCFIEDVFPVITWSHSEAEAYATDEDFENYILWWRKVAERLKDKDYRLSFNLFTKLEVNECKKTGDCEGSLQKNITKYNIWTSKVVDVIRGTGGNNEKRILILTSPKNTAKGLKLIDASIYKSDFYMMVEFQTYESGPNKKENSPKYWEGNGTTEQRKTLLDEIAMAENDIPLKLYVGAWMPQDGKFGGLVQSEVENFARYFVSVMKTKKIPSSLKVLDVYYDTEKSTWLTGTVNVTGQPLNMYKVLNVIKESL